MSAVRTTDKYERTFTLAVPPERAWRAFTEPREMEAWFRDRVHEFDARPGGRVRYEMVGITVEGVVEEARPHRLLRWTAGPGLLPGPTVISVSFERVGGGTQITITQSGFGDGDEWLTELEDHALGWNQLITDLSLYLGTGVSFKRMPTWRVWLGARFTDTPAGVEVVDVSPDGFAARAGIQPGDLLVQLGRAPIFSRSDLWLVQREHDPGEEMDAAFIRGRELQRSTARL